LLKVKTKATGVGNNNNISILFGKYRDFSSLNPVLIFIEISFNNILNIPSTFTHGKVSPPRAAYEKCSAILIWLSSSQ